MSLGLSPSTRPRARSAHSVPNPASCTDSALLIPEATAPDHDALIVHACRSVRTDLLAHEVIRDQPMLKDTLTSNYDTLTLRQEATISTEVAASPDDYGRRIITARQGKCPCRDTLPASMRTHLTSLNFTTAESGGAQTQQCI